MSNPTPTKLAERTGPRGPNQQQRFRRADAPPPITLTASSARYRQILGAIWNLGGALTTAQIGAWLESPGKGHYGPLKALYQHGYLERRYLPTRAPGIGGGETIHVLTRKGVGVAIGEAYDDVRDGVAIDNVAKRAPRTLEHQIAIAEVRLLIELGARSLDELAVVQSLGDKEQPWLSLTVRLAPVKKAENGRVTRRRPDGLETLDQGSHVLPTLLEVDLDDTRPRKTTRFLERFDVYIRAMTMGVIEPGSDSRSDVLRPLTEQLQLGDVRPGLWPVQVLFITKTAERRDALRKMAADRLPAWRQQWKDDEPFLEKIRKRWKKGQPMPPEWQDKWLALRTLMRSNPPFLFGSLEGWTHRWDKDVQDYVHGVEVDEDGNPTFPPHTQLIHAAHRLYREPILLGLRGKPAHFYT